MDKFKDLPIGIDLGTTFSCIGVYRNSSIEIIPNEINDRTTPSIVSFIDDEIYVGEQTKYKKLKKPENKIYAIKRIIGRNFEDKEVQEDIKNFTYKIINDNGRPQIEVDSNGIKKFHPEEICAKILSKLKKSAESFLEQEIKKVVITVPAYFTERQKQATKNAGEIAGLEVIKIINEPTAAALAYGFGKCQNNNHINLLGKCINFDENQQYTYRSNDTNSNADTDYNDSEKIQKETKTILVFDLGGGTLDVTLLELEKDDISVINHSGIMHLGGEDFDNRLLKYCIDTFKNKKPYIDLTQECYKRQYNRLKEKCEMTKRILSFKEEDKIIYESIVNGENLIIEINRAKFVNLCEDLFIKCLEPIKEVLKDSKLDKNNIDEIVLVGGSTRIPYFKDELLKNYFEGKIKINNILNPDEAVAYGATIEAAMELGNYSEDITLLDVCPFSLGVAVKNYEDPQNGLKMCKMIEKGTKLPYCYEKKDFQPSSYLASEVYIEVYEGESSYVKYNYPLGKFILENIPKDIHKNYIDITFDLNSYAILTVTAVVRENNSSNSIRIKNYKGGLSKDEIEEAKKKQENETFGKDLENEMKNERNYKKEIFELINTINNSFDNEYKKYYYLTKLTNTIEKFINSFNNDIIDIYNATMYFYLNYLFSAYSLLFSSNLIEENDKNDIISKIKKYLEIFEKSGTSYCYSLVIIFINNNDNIFGDLCIQILGYYSSRGTEFYIEKNKKWAKHYLEEALLLNKKLSVEKRIENNPELKEKFKSIKDNCEELINIIKAEKIQEYFPNFSKCNLIDENNFNQEEIIDILDRFNEALKYLENPKKKEDKLLKALYLGNIIKIQYKIFKVKDYDTLLKMIEECINLKTQVPQGCESNLNWFEDICNYKLEIVEKKKILKENPEIEENNLKEKVKDIINKINEKFNEGEINFFFYITTNHEPPGLPEKYKFKNIENLKGVYYSNQKKFIKDINKKYNPQRFSGDKEEDQKNKIINEEIHKKLNSLLKKYNF